LLGFETVDGLPWSWAHEVPSGGESQPPVIGPRIIIKPERHPPGPGNNLAVDLGVVGGGDTASRIEQGAQPQVVSSEII
jgi:hypothetical protein